MTQYSHILLFTTHMQEHIDKEKTKKNILITIGYTLYMYFKLYCIITMTS